MLSRFISARWLSRGFSTVQSLFRSLSHCTPKTFLPKTTRNQRARNAVLGKEKQPQSRIGNNNHHHNGQGQTQQQQQKQLRSGRISSKSGNSNSRSSGCRSTSNRNSNSNRNGSTSNKDGDSERGEQRQRASEGLEIISKGTSADCGNCKAQSASTLSIDEGMECSALALFPPYAQASHFKQQNPMCCASSCSSGNVWNMREYIVRTHHMSRQPKQRHFHWLSSVQELDRHHEDNKATYTEAKSKAWFLGWSSWRQTFSG